MQDDNSSLVDSEQVFKYISHYILMHWSKKDRDCADDNSWYIFMK